MAPRPLFGLLLAVVVCVAVTPATALATPCKTLGQPCLATGADIGACVAKEVACRTDQMLESATPRLDQLLDVGGVTLP